MKVLVGAFNQENALVGAYSVIVQLHRLIDLRHYYRFLQTHTENNIALRETDQKKNRKRNFVPASFGMIHVAFYLLTYLGHRRQAQGLNQFNRIGMLFQGNLIFVSIPILKCLWELFKRRRR